MDGMDSPRCRPHPTSLRRDVFGNRIHAALCPETIPDPFILISSMSRKGNCWDNACVESFFGTLKRDLVSHRHYVTRDEARQEILEYIKVFYNQQRQHSTLGYHSPAAYEVKTAVA